MSKPENSDSPQSMSETATQRRAFLGGIGALGLSAIAGSIAPQTAAAMVPATAQASANLDSVASLEVTREQNLHVPGGQENFYEWQATDSRGATNKFLVHSSRVDSGNTYTISTDITIHKFAPGASPDSAPRRSTQQHITAFGTKGEVADGIRQDHVILTTVHSDGTSTREERTVPVRLDFSEFAGMDFAAIAASTGRRMIERQ